MLIRYVSLKKIKTKIFVGKDSKRQNKRIPCPLMLGTCYITQISAAAPDVRYWRKLIRKIYRQPGKGKRVGRKEVATKSNRPPPLSSRLLPNQLSSPLIFFSLPPFGWSFVYVQSQNI